MKAESPTHQEARRRWTPHPPRERDSEFSEESKPEEERRRPLVLVVEDDPHHWEIYGKILWYNGFDIVHAEDGAEGLRLALRHEPDLMLIDLVLPEMDGIELCRRCRRVPELSGIPIVMLTGMDRKTHGDPAREAGCDQFLEKPQSPTEVLRCVERMLGRPPPSGEDPRPVLTG